MLRPPVVLVVGDFLVDRYWIGEASRISPEAPIPVVRVSGCWDVPGGAGNVARNLQHLSISTVCGREGTNLPIKNRLMVGDVQLARWDENDCCKASFWLPDNISELSGVVIADYQKGTITPRYIEMLGGLNLPTFVDTKGDPTPYLVNFRDVTMFPNLKEYSSYKDIYNQFRCCVLKKSSEGISLLEYGKEIASVGSKARFVRSVNGAGDTVVAGWVGSKLKNLTNPLEYAAWCAGSVVEQPYTAVPKIALGKEFYLSDMYV